MMMRSIFLKIFLWFWAAMVLVGMALTLIWTVQPDLIVSRWRASTAEAVGLYAQSVAEEMDRYGAVPLGNYLQRLQAAGHLRAALLDENGNVLAGKAPAAAMSLAPQAKLNGEPAFSIRANNAYAAQRVQGPSGRIYVLVVEMPRGPAGSFRWRGFVTRWLIEILISALICYLLTWYLTRPIVRLRAAAGEIASGNLAARADTRMERRRDEMGGLVKDFNTMAMRIESLVSSQRQLVRDISHELRSPLARMTVALGLARKRTGDQLEATLNRIELEAERLNDLIGKLLSLARMESVASPPLQHEIDLRDLLTEVVADADFEAGEHDCRVVLQGDGDCVLRGNRDMLRSAFENVVRNAVHYTAPGSTVEVNILPASSNRRAAVAVRDHGPGVPEADLANIFRPFFRLTDARERSTGGAGVGLAITERAIRLHSGRVDAHNAPDGGLVVMFDLPCVPTETALSSRSETPVASGVSRNPLKPV